MGFSAKLIVVSGPPRSGTTLANRILCASPRCAPFLPECSFITKQIEQYANILLYSDRERFSAYFGTLDACRSCFRACIDAHLDALLRARPQVAGHEYVVLKDPMLAYHLAQAQELLPAGTRFVLTVRNPLAIIASMKQVESRKGADWNIETTVNEIFNFYFHLNRVREEGRLASACYVKYEDLVLGNWEAMEAFLGFPVSDALKISKHERVFDKQDPFYTPLYEKQVSGERVDAWQSELSEAEISYVRGVFSGVMACWGDL